MTDMRRVDWIVVHTAAAWDATRQRVLYQSIDDIRRYHVEHNGWRDIGYHWVIEHDGKLSPGRPESEPGAHVGGFNAHTIGVCVTGHGDHADFLPAQKLALVGLCTRLCRKHHLSGIRVIGHREAERFGAPPTPKTCPGLLVDMDELRGLVADRLDGASGPAEVA